jgi:hypothetical protein
MQRRKNRETGWQAVLMKQGAANVKQAQKKISTRRTGGTRMPPMPQNAKKGALQQGAGTRRSKSPHRGPPATQVDKRGGVTTVVAPACIAVVSAWHVVLDLLNPINAATITENVGMPPGRTTAR